MFFDPSPVNEAFRRLDEVLARIGKERRFALAFSGGMDSRFLAHAAGLLGYTPVLLHISGPHIAAEETQNAELWARARELEFQRLDLNPLDIPEVAAGDERRCYFCKRALFQELRKRTDLPVCDGTNVSDLSVYRPGRQALGELGIASPLAEAGLNKANIHELALRTALDRPFQKPSPCLLTRFPYGMPVKGDLLKAVGRGEQAVRAIFADAGIPCPDFRLRVLGGRRAVLHLTEQDRQALSPEFCQKLVLAAAMAAPELPPLTVETVDRISGFFDKA